MSSVLGFYHQVVSRFLARNRSLRQSRRGRRNPIGGVECCELRLLLTAPNPLALGSVDGTSGFRVNGITAGDLAGYPVSNAGDVNGDGFDDLIVGASLADPGGKPGAGESYVVFGKAGGFGASLDLSTLNGTNGFKLVGGAVNDGAGRAVSAAGDINGDGFGDLLVGANFASPGGKEFAGETYVVFGKAIWSSTVDLSALNGADGFKIPGIDPRDAVDLPVTWISSAGDVNGDGYADIVIGASGGDGANNLNPGSGECDVIYGKSGAFPATFDLTTLNGTNGFQINGISQFDGTGFAVSTAGDMNGDGIDDIVVSNDSTYSPGPGTCDVIFGKSTGMPASFDLSTLNGANGFQFTGLNPLGFLGFSVSNAGDVNNDGFGDIIVGAPSAAPGGKAIGGEAYVLFGKSSGFGVTLDLNTLNGTNGFRIDGINAGDAAGLSVSNAGDVNGDGIDDIILGASGGDPGSNVDAGQAYVIFGRTGAFAAAIDLATLDGMNGFRLDGQNAGDTAGVSVSAAGDVNGDGFGDILVAANHGDPGGRTDAGEAYVVFGGNLTGGVETQVGTSAADTLTANQGAAAGDVLIGAQGNDILIGDGGPDVLLGGAGDDTIAIGSTNFRRVDGGSGTDTLKLAGSGLTLDLTTLADNRIQGIEQIDMNGSGANTLTLNQREVLNLSNESNTLLIRRGADDIVNIGNGWTQAANQTIGVDTFQVFVQGAATVKVQIASSVVLTGTTLNVNGTENSDTVTVSEGANLVVAVNGMNFTYNPANVTAINIHLDGGSDMLTFTGSSGGETATLRANNTLDVAGPSYTLHADGVESLRAFGGGGTDVANLYDSAGNDTLTATPVYSLMTGTGFSSYVNGFDKVNAYATAGGVDRANLYDSAGNDAFTGTPVYALLTGTGFSNYAKGFDTVNAYATAGGTDTANLYDSAGNDVFTGTPVYALLTGTGFSNYAKGFDTVNAYATAGGTDRANLYDSAGNDTFTGKSVYGLLTGTGFFNYAKGFDTVYAYATAGGTDTANLYDSSGNDTFAGTSVYGLLMGTGFYNYAKGFDTVNAYATAGGTDAANLYDSSGNDTFTGTPVYGLLTGTGFSNFAKGFDTVYAYATAGGTDRANLYDSAGNDTFTGKSVYGLLTGTGFFNYAKGFDTVYAYATAGGADRANLYDSAGNDTFTGTPAYGLLTGTGFSNYARGFDTVYAYATAGGADRASLYDSAGNDIFYGRSNYGYLAGTGFYNSVSLFGQIDVYANAGGMDTLNVQNVTYAFSKFGTWENVL